MDVRRWIRRKTPYDVRVFAALLWRLRAGRVPRLPAMPAKERPPITWSSSIQPCDGLDGDARRQLRLACEDLDGRVLAPGAVFSFWANVRRPSGMDRYRSIERRPGKPLPVDAVDALSLVAGLAYGVALRGGLEIRERHAHRHRPSGLPGAFETGEDAAVEYGLRDLQFRNTTGTPLVFDVTLDEIEASCDLRAAQHVPFDVTFDVRETVTPPATLVIADPGLRPGEERIISPGRPGARVEIIRITHRATGERTREVLPVSEYDAIDTVAGRGALVREAAPARPR